MIRQYQDAKDAIPEELLPENQEAVEEEEHEAEATSSDRSWFSRMTFGIFD